MTKFLENAYDTQKPDKGLIFHSNLGTQYTSEEFAKTINKFNMTHSFSSKGNLYDNACTCSFHAILKIEEVNHVRYYDFDSANLALFEYIEGWYNRKRIHGSIEYKTPQEMYLSCMIHNHCTILCEEAGMIASFGKPIIF